ncbi:MAG: hypothetical protein K0R29_529 [Pseudobdellovibrio sp.]|jgi:hypothetical protein|nr:hypothetical protein [Pseudobdellovibrio sp.]
MKHIIFAAAAMMLLTACDPFEGVLSVKQPLTVQHWDGENYVQVAVPVGDVSAKVEFASKNQINITAKINGKKQTLKLVTAKKLSVPENGPINIPAADLAQNFSAVGKSETVVTDGGIQQGYESCTYQRRETRCFTDNKGHVICRDYWVTVNGRQFVEYQVRNTSKDIAVDFVRDNNVLASLTGHKAYSERLIRYQGQCF